MHDFSFNHYRKIMKQINKNNYKSLFYDEEYIGKQVLVRHDIDIDLDAAVEIAKIENEEGIKATYYIWINSPFYNIFEKRYIELINRIINYGHQIGLHFDETVYAINSKKDILTNIDREVSLIQTYFNVKINSISFHRPSKYVLENDLDLHKYVNTYSHKLFKEYKYISDSNGIWKEGCGCTVFSENKYEKIQFLTHPIWWKKDSSNPDERLTNYLQFKINKIERDLNNNISRYKIKNFELKE